MKVCHALTCNHLGQSQPVASAHGLAGRSCAQQAALPTVMFNHGRSR